MKLVRVNWMDIGSYDGPWMDLSEAKEMRPVPMETVGYILEMSETHIVVCSTVSEDGAVGSVNSIPRGVVTGFMPLTTVPSDLPLECDDINCDTCGCLGKKSESL